MGADECKANCKEKSPRRVWARVGTFSGGWCPHSKHCATFGDGSTGAHCSFSHRIDPKSHAPYLTFKWASRFGSNSGQLDYHRQLCRDIVNHPMAGKVVHCWNHNTFDNFTVNLEVVSAVWHRWYHKEQAKRSGARKRPAAIAFP